MATKQPSKKTGEAPRTDICNKEPLGRHEYRKAIAAVPLAHARVSPTMKPGPNAYALRTEGDCLAPDINDGDVVICDPDAQPSLGDFIAIWWKGGSMPPGIKRLVSTLPPRAFWDNDALEAVVIVEQSNPPKRLAPVMARVAEIHKVLGKQQETNHG